MLRLHLIVKGSLMKKLLLALIAASAMFTHSASAQSAKPQLRYTASALFAQVLHTSSQKPRLVESRRVFTNAANVSPVQLRAAWQMGPWCQLKNGRVANAIKGPASPTNTGRDYDAVFRTHVAPAIKKPAGRFCWARTQGAWKGQPMIPVSLTNAYVYRVEFK